MSQDVQKYLDAKGVEILWKQINLKDYPNNETLMAVLNAIDQTKADKNELNTKVNISDIADNLTTAEEDKPLSANQGYILNQTITNIQDNIEDLANIAATKDYAVNLLDNWYFGNPVDQRGGYVVPPGVTVYSDTALTTQTASPTSAYRVVELKGSYAQFWWASESRYLYVAASDCVRGYTTDTPFLYGLDRWKFAAGSIRKGTDSWRFISKTTTGTYPRIVQLSEGTLKARTTYTLSALVDIHSYTGDVLLRPCSSALATVSGAGVYIITSADVGTKKLISVTFTPSVDAPNFGVEILCLSNTGAASIDIDIYAMKLELGSVQTLAHQENGVWVLNEIPDYNEQLLRCCMSTADSSDTYANNKLTHAAVGAELAGLVHGTYNSAGTDEKFLAIVNSVYESMPDNSVRNIIISFSGSHPVIGGNAFLVEIYRRSARHGSLMAKTYGGLIYYRSFDAGVWRDFYRLATTDCAVPLDGSKAMTGDLTIAPYSYRGLLSVKDGRYERKAQIEQNTDRTWLNNLLDNANFSSVLLRPETEALTERLQLVEKINNSQKKYNILHTGNKPSGKYTGNGSSAYRQISTGGLPGLCLVTRSGGYWALISSRGALMINGTEVTADNRIIFDAAGQIQLNTANPCLNENNVEYTYYVL